MTASISNPRRRWPTLLAAAAAAALQAAPPPGTMNPPLAPVGATMSAGLNAAAQGAPVLALDFVVLDVTADQLRLISTGRFGASPAIRLLDKADAKRALEMARGRGTVATPTVAMLDGASGEFEVGCQLHRILATLRGEAKAKLSNDGQTARVEMKLVSVKRPTGAKPGAVRGLLPVESAAYETTFVVPIGQTALVALEPPEGRSCVAPTALMVTVRRAASAAPEAPALGKTAFPPARGNPPVRGN